MITITADGDDGEPPGVVLDEKLMVTKIELTGVLVGKVEIGDVFKTLNGIKLPSKNEFLTKWQRCLPNITLTMVRSAGNAAAVLASRLPEEVEKLIIRKPGHEYIIIPVEVGDKKLLGLALETLVNKVVVVGIRPMSVGAEKFKRWDSILAIDRIRVSEAQVAKHLIRDRAGKFEAVIERGPESTHAANEKALAFKRAQNIANESDDWASFAGPTDVQEIVADAIPKRRLLTVAPSIFNRSPRPRTGKTIALNDNHVVTHIVSDIEHNKPLRKVPKL